MFIMIWLISSEAESSQMVPCDTVKSNYEYKSMPHVDHRNRFEETQTAFP